MELSALVRRKIFLGPISDQKVVGNALQMILCAVCVKTAARRRALVSERCNNQQPMMSAWRVEGIHMKAWVCLLWVSKLHKLQNQPLM